MLKVNSNGIEYYTREGLELHQKAMINLVRIISEVCDDNDIDYWLDGGSLLGLARGNGIIPWDDDIDICIPQYDWERLINLLDEYCLSDNNYCLYFKSKNVDSWCEYFGVKSCFSESEEGFFRPVKIDLFPVRFVLEEDLKNDEEMVEEAAVFIKGPYSKKNKKEAFSDKKRFLLKYRSYCKEHEKHKKDTLLIKGHGQFSPIKNVKEEVVYPLVFSDFEGLKIKVPNKINEYLIKTYGESYMSLPPLEKRMPYDIRTFKVESHERAELLLDSVLNFDDQIFYLNGKKRIIVYKLREYLRNQGVMFAIKKILMKVVK
mgnify:CR=1 FL=1|tara:strand:- start:4014 stop:4964 length:951 start_codon:yes stop_codon:yes gene_type:complete